MSIVVEALGRGNSRAEGKEVWLLEVRSGSKPMNLDTLRGAFDEKWTTRTERALGKGAVLVADEPARAELSKPPRAPLRLTFLTHDWSGMVRIRNGEQSRVFDLFSPEVDSVEIICSADGRIARVDEEADLLMSSFASDDVIGLAAPKWRGVYNATTDLLPHVVAFPHQPDRAPSELRSSEIDAMVERILRASPRDWIVSGGDRQFLDVAKRVKAIDPEKRFYLLFHGAFFALGMTFDREVLISWIDSCRRGDIDGIMTVKRGVDALCRRLGAESAFIPLPFPKPQPAPARKQTAKDNRRLGVWLSRSDDPRKICPALPYALAGLDKVELHGAGLAWDYTLLLSQLDVPMGEIAHAPIPRLRLMQRMSGMDLNLYLTASECSPMLPLESLSLGVPCLMGPVTYYFDDDPWLRERLVVRDIADAVGIQAAIERALAEREEIMARYADYAARRQGQSTEAIRNFIHGVAA